MRSLLEFRDKIKYYYRKYEFIMLPTLKFMLAYLAICCINGSLGYMDRIDSLGIVLIASLLCSFLPSGFLVFIASIFSLLHMYTLSLEVALVGICIYLVMLLMFMRFDSKHTVILVLTAICCAMKIPHLIPIAVGLLASPVAAVSVVCGLVTYSLIDVISVNASVINGMGKGEEITKIRLVLDGLLKNGELQIMIAAFVITIIVVYIVRRLSVDYSWSIAVVAGTIINVVIILIGDLVYDTNVSLLGTVASSVLALAVGKIIEFLCFGVDYSRTENVQFEDDDYYYYVKAVPKMTVAVQSKTVKKINSQRSTAQKNVGSSRGGQRSVMTEYGEARRNVQHNPNLQRDSRIKNTAGGGRSVTIGNYLDEDDVEDLDE